MKGGLSGAVGARWCGAKWVTMHSLDTPCCPSPLIFFPTALSEMETRGAGGLSAEDGHDLTQVLTGPCGCLLETVSEREAGVLGNRLLR